MSKLADSVESLNYLAEAKEKGELHVALYYKEGSYEL